MILPRSLLVLLQNAGKSGTGSGVELGRYIGISVIYRRYRYCRYRIGAALNIVLLDISMSYR